MAKFGGLGLAGEQYERADSPMEVAQDKRQAKKAKMPVSKFEESPGDMEPAIKPRKNDKMPTAKKNDGGTPAKMFGPKRGF
jgi:hypothetical protein